jgi:hypothetical protein
MAAAEGQEVYSVDTEAVVARGAAFSEEALDELLRERVVAIVTDISGREDVRQLLADLPSTSFESERLEELVADPLVEELWRIGEAIGEAFLTDCRDCTFPWPSGRDQKNPAASLPGADLVGFVIESGSDRLAFGEVKTSSSEETPPKVMYGRSGLVAQLENLRDSVRAKNALVLYLAYRADSSDWRERFRTAAGRYFADDSDVSLFGVLVRDIPPAPLDLQTRASALAAGQPARTSIELRAKYLPVDSLSRIVDRVQELLRDAGHS